MLSLENTRLVLNFFFNTRTYSMLSGTNITVNLYNMVPVAVDIVVHMNMLIQISFSFLYPDSDLDSIVGY